MSRIRGRSPRLFLLGGILTGVVLLGATALFFFQGAMVYFPSTQLDADPSAVGLTFEDVHLTTADGTRLHGWYVPTSISNRPVVLYCHGNAGNISGRLNMLRALHGLALNVLIFDYRGYGRSDGAPGEQGTYEDVATAWDHLRSVRGFPPHRIVLLGRSLGGAIAAHQAAREAPGGLILVSAFTSLADVGTELYPYLPVRWLGRIKYPTLENVKKAKCPVLILHSRDDEVTAFHHGRDLFEGAPEPKTFVELAGGHNDILDTCPDTFLDGISRFVASLN